MAPPNPSSPDRASKPSAVVATESRVQHPGGLGTWTVGRKLMGLAALAAVGLAALLAVSIHETGTVYDSASFANDNCSCSCGSGWLRPAPEIPAPWTVRWPWITRRSVRDSGNMNPP